MPNPRPLSLLARSVWVAAALLAAVLAGGPARAQSEPVPLASFGTLVDKVSAAVVNIATSKQQAREDMPVPQFPPGSPFEEFFKEFFDRERGQQPQPQQRGFSLGSGFVIDPEGYVVTNNHVIAEADEITVNFSDETKYTAKLVGRDTKTDLALLKIDGDKPFPFVEWADSDKVKVGDWMLAIGNPFGLGSTVTAGIVSARGRQINSGPYDDFFQVDAAINRGNSGGPSFTLEGKVFGINTAIFSPTGGNVGIGFAIPSNLAKPVIASLRNTGRVARGWLGVRIQTVTDDIAENLGLETPVGALVAGVTPGGPAEKAGIVAGDVVIEFDGKPIAKMRDLPRIVAETPIGQVSKVVVQRKGERKTVDVTLGELPEDEQLSELGQPAPETPPGTGVEVGELGLTLKVLDDALRQQFSLPQGAKGVVVAEVADGSTAANEGLKAGDLIVEVNQEEVATPDEVAGKVAKLKQDGKKSVLLLVDRQGDLRFVALRFAAG
ncbi:MAG: Do family serine endopeptidase [Geminicoccaceae bacterium]